jgi:hypothetical protein
LHSTVRSGGALIALLTAAAASAQTADPVRVRPSGTAAIGGVVVTDALRAEPVRKAVVVLRSELTGSWSLVTADDGRFSFLGLPAARFDLHVSKPGYIETTYGATSIGGQGTPIAVGANQTVDVTIRIARGAALEGRILTEIGEPLGGVQVSAMRVRPDAPPARAGEPMVTDDRGMYRLFGLPPGEYLVLARYLIAPVLERPSAADVESELRALGRTSRQGAQVLFDDGGGRMTPDAVVFAPSYFPGTWAIDRATAVRVAAGEEKLGLDFAFTPVPMGRIRGQVSGAAYPRAVQVHVQAATDAAIPHWTQTVRPDETGAFELSRVPPGRYTAVARADPDMRNAPVAEPSVMQTTIAAVRDAAAVTVAYQWARTDAQVIGGDTTYLALTLAPGARLDGRVRFDVSEQPTATDVTGIRIVLSPVNLQQTPVVSRGGVLLRHEAHVREDGSFSMAGIGPGAYTASVTLPGARLSAGWWPRSLVAGGADWLDVGPMLAPGVVVPNVVLTVADRRASVAGRLQAPSGAPASDYFVVVFSADRAHWQALSRRTQVARPATDGRFEIRDLPAGEYFIGAVTSIDRDELLNGGFFQQLAPLAIRFGLADGEQRVQDAQIVR